MERLTHIDGWAETTLPDLARDVCRLKFDQLATFCESAAAEYKQQCQAALDRGNIYEASLLNLMAAQEGLNLASAKALADLQKGDPT